MLETCKVSGIYIYLGPRAVFADNDDVFFGNGTAGQWGYFLLHGSIYGYVSSVFVISVKVGGVVWKFLHNPVQRGLPEDAGTDGYGCEFPASIPAACITVYQLYINSIGIPDARGLAA